jgi:hypothetical protein
MTHEIGEIVTVGLRRPLRWLTKRSRVRKRRPGEQMFARSLRVISDELS